MKLYLEYDEYEEGGEVLPGHEDSAWPSYEPSYIIFKPRKLFLNRKNMKSMFPEEITGENIHGKFKSGDTAFMSVIRWATGSTFGTKSGHWKIEGIFSTYDESEERMREVLEDPRKSVDGYAYWNDYFGGYEDSETYDLRVC